MKMKIVYIAHPISGDIPGNIAKVKAIIKAESGPELYPMAPYLQSLEYLDDTKENERIQGIGYNNELFYRKLFDELWVYGISRGVKHEIYMASLVGIPVVFKF